MSRATTAGTEAESGGDEPPIRLRGDELDLYGEFHAELWRTIRATVRAPIETIDDACSFAWMQFLRYQPDRDASWQGWLVTTAQREAWRLNAIEWRERDFTHDEFLAIARSILAIATRSGSRSTRRWSSSRSFRPSCSEWC